MDHLVRLFNIENCDLHIPKMLGSEGQEIHLDEIVNWKGPHKNRIIKQFCKDVYWGELDLLIIDTPPAVKKEVLQKTEVRKYQVSMDAIEIDYVKAPVSRDEQEKSLFIKGVIVEENGNVENTTEQVEEVTYLLHVVSLSSSSCKLDEESVVYIRDFYDYKNGSSFDIASSDEETLAEPKVGMAGIRIGVLEGKVVATQALGLFVFTTMIVYVPYLEEILGILTKHVSSYYHDDKLTTVEEAVEMIMCATKQGDVWVIDHGDTEDMIKRNEEGLKLKEIDDVQQQQESLKKWFDEFFVSFLTPLMLYLHGWLLGVYLSSLPLHAFKMTSMKYHFLHLEDKVKVWADGIDKPPNRLVYQRMGSRGKIVTNLNPTSLFAILVKIVVFML